MKALIGYGSMGNYISDSLVPALGMEVIPERDFELLEMANKTTVKAQGYMFYFDWTAGSSAAELLPGCFPT